MIVTPEITQNRSLRSLKGQRKSNFFSINIVGLKQEYWGEDGQPFRFGGGNLPFLKDFNAPDIWDTIVKIAAQIKDYYSQDKHIFTAHIIELSKRYDNIYLDMTEKSTREIENKVKPLESKVIK